MRLIYVNKQHDLNRMLTYISGTSVDIIMLHANKKLLHVNIIELHADIILSCMYLTEVCHHRCNMKRTIAIHRKAPEFLSPFFFF